MQTESQEQTEEPQWKNECWIYRESVIYKCQLSSIYHKKLEQLYSILEKITNFIILLGGASAMTVLLPTAENKAIMSATIAFLTALSLAFSWNSKVRKHALLAFRFITLEAEIIGAGVLTSTEIDKFKKESLLIDREEPPQLTILTKICQNEIDVAKGVK